MTDGLPVCSGQQAVKALGKLGFRQVSQRGSHAKLRSEEGRTVIVPFTMSLHGGR